ncbi:hypothetical protein Syun_011722 [Stephania yunnanensis]|uniref:Uncharacterized protein n=1 Tax=Stephania yunnanensis TaxID=152371 RepID=A0AAP0K0H8_9MAGN
MELSPSLPSTRWGYETTSSVASTLMDSRSSSPFSIESSSPSSRNATSSPKPNLTPERPLCCPHYLPDGRHLLPSLLPRHLLLLLFAFD